MLRRLAREILPPFIARPIRRWAAIRPEAATSPPTQSSPRPTAPEELQQWLAGVEEASRVSDDALRKAVEGFRYRIELDLPSDPFSPAYRLAQMALYSRLSGRSEYVAARNEESPFDVDANVERPFPYSTLSCSTVGSQLEMQGAILRALDLAPNARVLEFGAGWGNLALHLALMGHRVTAVDVCPRFLELIERRSARLGVHIDTACDDMLDFRCTSPFDAVIFFESFHHCADHLTMLARLHTCVADEGFVLFGIEPITERPDEWGDYPWGVRLDGMSIFSMVKYGWLELGFTDAYFLEALRRSGWRGEIIRPVDTQFHVIVVARKEP